MAVFTSPGDLTVWKQKVKRYFT